MGTTPLGFPYPESTDFVTDGAQAIEDLALAIDSNLGAWTTYTPALQSSGTNPILGTGSTATGKYIKINKFVFGWFDVRFGTSGVNIGTGSYNITKPVNSAKTTHNFWDYHIGTGQYQDASTGNAYMLEIVHSSATQFGFYYWSTFNGALAGLGATTPTTMQNSDRFSGFFMYEAA